MKIAVCYKCVPFNESISVKGDRTLDLDKVTWEIGKYDLNAAEAACQIAAVSGDEAVAVSANGSVLADSKLRKSILSRGLTQLSRRLATSSSPSAAKAPATSTPSRSATPSALCLAGTPSTP